MELFIKVCFKSNEFSPYLSSILNYNKFIHTLENVYTAVKLFDSSFKCENLICISSICVISNSFSDTFELII